MSKQEEEIKNLLLAHNISFTQNDTNIINPFELDFYVPSQNLAIEINSLYHHSIKLGSNKSAMYHFDKSTSCAQKKIKLLHLYSYELFDTKVQWKRAIHFLMIALNIAKISNMNKKSFFKGVSFEEAEIFLKRNQYEDFEISNDLSFKAIYTNQKIQALISYKIVNKTLIIYNYCTMIFHQFDAGFKLLVESLLLMINEPLHLSEKITGAEIILSRDKYPDCENFATKAGFKLIDLIESEPYICSEDFNAIVKISKNPEEDLKAGKHLIYNSGKAKYSLK